MVVVVAACWVDGRSIIPGVRDRDMSGMVGLGHIWRERVLAHCNYVVHSNMVDFAKSVYIV